MSVDLGKIYRDSITGFEGVATASHEYIYGCRRISLTGMVEGKPEEFHFDEPALVQVGEEAVVEPTPELRATGGPRPTGSRVGLR